MSSTTPPKELPNAGGAPWHRASYDRFLYEHLPGLLADRLPLTGYRVEETGGHTCAVRVGLTGAGGDIEVAFEDVARPDNEGWFELDGRQLAVWPVAARDDLETAEISCVGEQLLDRLDAAIAQAPDQTPWDERLVRAWLCLDVLIADLLRERGVEYPAHLTGENWLARQAHLRRLRLPNAGTIWRDGHWGRVCPFETPEGPNVGRVLTIAVGASIRDGRLVRDDERPECALGLTAAMVPFLEHGDANRLLMGVNMVRQWMPPPTAEPALVRTGNEPDTPGFWCGRNLLTAFVNWGADTFEDGAVVSESCARRLGYPMPLEVGDKLSNRHGIKTVVCRVLPDDEMPHLPDGTPVEIAWDFMGLPSRIGLIGALREAVAGRLARAQGQPATVPPFQAPGEEELRSRLARAGLREDGMEHLTLGHGGVPLKYASTVGWVYWGRLHHVAREKLRVAVAPPAGERQGDADYLALRDVGAWETLREQFNTRATGACGDESLAARAAAREVEQAEPPAPAFAELCRRLAVGGIRTELEGEKLRFRFAPPEGATVRLARPVPHPWLRGQELTEVGALEELPEYLQLVTTNSRLERMVEGGYPPALVETWRERLEIRSREFFDALVTPVHLRFEARVLFSASAVAACGSDLRIDQIGVPGEIAWQLFQPLLQRERGTAAADPRQDPRAGEALDALMACSWVLVNRPGPGAAPWLAFRPVRQPEPVLRLHPLACGPLDADFDGDQLSLFLPLTAAGQNEAVERLSIAGRLRRDPGFLRSLQGMHAAKWGLADLSRNPEGREEIARALGETVPSAVLFGKNEMAGALDRILEREGVDAALERLDALMRLGFAASKASGASLGPFVGSQLHADTPAPAAGDADAWAAFAEEVAARLAAWSDFDDDEMGPVLLAMRSGARGGLRQLVRIIGPWAAPFWRNGVAGEEVIHHGYRDGLTPEETRGIIRGHWEGIDQANRAWLGSFEGLGAGRMTQPLTVLARARCWKRPGIVFAAAAASGEVEPLADPESRLFVGLAPA